MPFDTSEAARRRAAVQVTNHFVDSVLKDSHAREEQIVAEEVEKLRVSYPG